MTTTGALPGRRPALWWLIVAALTCAGAGFRGWQLDTQIVLDDEFWTLQAAAANDAAYLLSHHHWSDYSIPLALWTRWLAVTVGVTEWGFRLPVFALGCLAVPLAAVIALRFGRAEGVLTAALIASAPALVLYSRYTRPYMLVALLLLLVIVSWLRWIETGRHRFGGIFAAASAVAIYCSAIAAPAIIGVWMAAMASLWWLPRFGRTPIAPRGASIGWVAAACALVIALYAPSWTSFWQANVGKLAGGSLPAESWWGACRLLFGTRSGPVAIGLLANSALGAIVLGRRSQWLPLTLLGIPIVAQGLALVLAAPHGAESSYVLTRYLLVALPALLIFSSVGLTAQIRFVARWLGSPAYVTAALAVAVVGAVLSAVLGVGVGWGPLPEILRTNNDFVTHPDAYSPNVPSIQPERVSPFYGFLKGSEAEAIVEVPWPRAFRYTPYADYQALHGVRVWTVSAEPTFAAAGIRLDSTRPVAALRNQNIAADYIVLHKHVSDEMLHVAPGEHPGRLADPVSAAGRPIPPPSLVAMQTLTVRRALQACLANPTLRHVYEDDWLVVFATHPDAAESAIRWNDARPVRQTRPNIVFVLIDTLRADDLNAYGSAFETSPNLSSLAASGVLFERVIAPSSWTKTSMASIMTSRDPSGHGVRGTTHRLPDALDTLAEMFSDAGYRTVGINGNPWLNPMFGFAQGFHSYETHAFANARTLNQRALTRLAAGPRRPTFLYIHYMDVHAPYQPSAEAFGAPPLTLPGRGSVSDGVIEKLYRKEGLGGAAVDARVRALYRAEIRDVDTALGELLRALHSNGFLKNGIVVVTSDHGEGFREHGTVEHGANLYPEVYRVPLVITGAGYIPSGRRIAAQVRSIDIAPTLLRLAGIDLPSGFEGQPMLPMEPGRIQDRVARSAVGLNDFAPDHDFVSVVTPDYLYIREKRSGRVELYDLRADPGARHDLGAGHRAAKRLASYENTGRSMEPMNTELDASTRAQLEALGYLDGSD